MKYRKLPVIIDAEQYRSWRTLSADMAAPPNTLKYTEEGTLLIQTLEGVMEAFDGDWIIKDVAGEFYPVKDKIFRATYECVEEAQPA